MSTDFDESFFTRDDPEIAVTITHNRDRIAFGGKVEQDYNYLNYVFSGQACKVEACMYLDDVRCVRITVPVVGTAIPEPVMAYLQRLFDDVLQLGGPEGYDTLWSSKPSE
jgi:hypothetical protein